MDWNFFSKKQLIPAAVEKGGLVSQFGGMGSVVQFRVWVKTKDGTVFYLAEPSFQRILIAWRKVNSNLYWNTDISLPVGVIWDAGLNQYREVQLDTMREDLEREAGIGIAQAKASAVANKKKASAKAAKAAEKELLAYAKTPVSGKDAEGAINIEREEKAEHDKMVQALAARTKKLKAEDAIARRQEPAEAEKEEATAGFSANPRNPAQIPIIITPAMELQLKELGYSTSDIGKMKPATARGIIEMANEEKAEHFKRVRQLADRATRLRTEMAGNPVYWKLIAGRGKLGDSNWGAGGRDIKILKKELAELKKHIGERVLLTGGGGPGGTLCRLRGAEIEPVGFMRPGAVRPSQQAGLRVHLTNLKGVMASGRTEFDPWIDSWQISVTFKEPKQMRLANPHMPAEFHRNPGGFPSSYRYVEPLNRTAWVWLKEHTGGDTSWEGITEEEYKAGKFGKIIVDVRYFDELVDGILNDGFVFLTHPGQEPPYDFKAEIAW